jgi:hypothetical protein
MTILAGTTTSIWYDRAKKWQLPAFGLWNIRISMMSIKDSAYHRNPQPKGDTFAGDAQNISLNAGITGVRLV